MNNEKLIEPLQTSLREAQDENRADQMSAYMKGKFFYYGVSAPLRQKIQKEWFAQINVETYDFWEMIYALFEKNEREFQMVAIDMMKKRSPKQFSEEDWRNLEHTIVTKSWWDTVDLIASNYVGKYFLKYPEEVEPVITSWRNSNNLWLQRTCLIFQLKHKEAIDFKLLTDLIDQFKGDKEFFIQKAIGWSLRQHSRTNPNEVKSYLENSGLEGLARREAERLMK
ncbi:MAG: DNA alkylation repair protein [Crocinitomicaceae bacterium]|nr:DNA alkylation repair protein [Crocinitomicaceae bacterium]MDG1659238.1 DNA alkylation repair protein [Crocinitomicaceae bacterium]